MDRRGAAKFTVASPPSFPLGSRSRGPHRPRNPASMHPDVLWLVRLGLDRGFFTRAQCADLRTRLGEDAALEDFAQQLIDDGIVENLPALEQLAGIALAKGRAGPPALDPFDAEETRAAVAPETATPPPDAAAKSAAVAPAAPPVFPFDRIAALDDEALAAALRALLRGVARAGASDLHLSTGARPFIRKNRALTFLADAPLEAADALRLNTALLSPAQKAIFLERRDYDCALAPSETDRYRVNLMFHQQGAAGAYRMVPSVVKSLADLGFAAHLKTLEKLLSYHNGLILVTGPVGAGKTTTLAAMVDHLNRTRTDHIITVEDPIEVVQPAKGCNVTQREVGPHTQSFFTALKGALREDPDIIVIGELRDLETIEMAITASETGHLVIGTLHTSDAATTLNRLLDVFPPAQQSQIRSSVAESLRGIVCQRLLPDTDGGLVLACELLVSTTAIQNLIREGKSAGLRNTMETGVKEGMCLMDNAVFSLWQDRRVSDATALAQLTNRVLRAKISR